MKTGYKKLLLFQLIFGLFLFLNSFVSNILKGYSAILFLVISILIFKYFLGFEKDKKRYTKDLIFEIVIFLLAFFLLFYIFGIVIGFAKTGNYYTVYGFRKFIIPNILTVILREVLRYQMLQKSDENALTTVLTIILFLLFDVSSSIYYNDFSDSYETFLFIALYLLPAISNNIISCYISKISGYRPIIFYLLVIELYQYLLPIIPNPNEYIYSIIHFLLPIVLGYQINQFFMKEKDLDIDRNYNKKNFSSLIIPSLIVVVIVYFTSGYFKYYAIAIASGSMSDVINKGDVVVVEKTDKYDTLKEKDVIAFKYNGVIVVHRIIDITRYDGKYYYYTKGDANPMPDNYAVEEEMIVGKIKLTIPFLGLPTVWINGM